MSEKIYVESLSNSVVCIDLPQLRLRKEWTRRGQKIPVDREALAEAIFDPGVEYMFKKGILYIEDLEFKKEIGLEDYDATEPTKIVPMTEQQMKRYLTVMPLQELEGALNKLSSEQKRELAAYAVQNELVGDLARTDILNKVCGVDLYKSLSLKRKNEAD